MTLRPPLNFNSAIFGKICQIAKFKRSSILIARQIFPLYGSPLLQRIGYYLQQCSKCGHLRDIFEGVLI